MTEPPHACDEMRYAVNEQTLPVLYSGKYRRYGIEYTTGGSSQQIAVCPFCGVLLPESLRDEWFTRIEGMGLDPWEDAIPTAFQSDQWWRDAGL